MAYSELLRGRIRDVLADRSDVVEKRMFGGVAFMVSGNMACGPMGDDLIVRIGDLATAKALKEPHVKPMDFTGKVMKSFVIITKAGIRTDAQLGRWVKMAAAYAASLPAKKAKPSRPRVKKVKGSKRSK